MAEIKENLPYSLKNQTSFNMAALIFRRQDEFITKAQQFHDSALIVTSPPNMLRFSFSAAKHALICTEFVLKDKDQESLNGSIKTISEKFTKLFSISNKVEYEKAYLEIHDLIFKFLRDIYEAQQKVNLGIPIEKLKGAARDLNEEV